MEHVRNLESTGLVEPHRLGNRKYEFLIVHNSARRRLSADADIPKPVPRSKKPSPFLSKDLRVAREVEVRQTRDEPRGRRGSTASTCIAADAGRSRSTRSEEVFSTTSEVLQEQLISHVETRDEADSWLESEFRVPQATVDLRQRCEHCGGYIEPQASDDFEMACGCPFSHTA